MRITGIIPGVLALAALSAPLHAAGDGAKLFESRCAACHAVSPPEKDVARLWERKGPSLYHAGDKFRPDWLVAWLQAPKPIRPGGVFYRAHVKAGADGDRLDTGAVPPHPALSAEEAQAVSDYLMSLHAPEGYIEDIEVSPPSRMDVKMGRLFFVKLRGCGACHQSEPGTGGESGPELYTAGTRLQPEFIYSYVKHPQQLDPGVWMPDQELSEADLKRLTGYLLSLTGEEN